MCVTISICATAYGFIYMNYDFNMINDFIQKTIMMALDISILSAIQSGQSRKSLKYTLHLKGLHAAPRHKQPHTKKNFPFLLTTPLQIFHQPTPCCLLIVLS